MKKIFLSFIFSISFLLTYGQGLNVIGTPSSPQYIYVGSLMKDINAASNVGKIKIELFGGDSGSAFTGSIVYRIGTRYGYRINKESFGGSNAIPKHKLRIFENGDNIDIVIETIGWTVYMIRSWQAGHVTTPLEVKCGWYNITGKNDITDKFPTTIYLTSDSSGNIGIGGDDPKSKLDVRGKIIADAVEIKVNKTADFVFAPDYNLPSLSEVETFVKENRHLPEIPSEKEMKENGLDINDMQIKLLQKIEELTLYVIEQDKKYNDIKKELEELKKE